MSNSAPKTLTVPLSRTLKIQLQPLPVPFLFTNSSVNDFYYGDISTPFSAVITSDVSLVMYYAPWDFDSQLTRSALERIAQKYRGQVNEFNFGISASSNPLFSPSLQGLCCSVELLGPKWRLPSKLSKNSVIPLTVGLCQR